MIHEKVYLKAGLKTNLRAVTKTNLNFKTKLDHSVFLKLCKEVFGLRHFMFEITKEIVFFVFYINFKVIV